MSYDPSLPEMCFSFLHTNPPGRQIIAITRGERGYNGTTYDERDPVKAAQLVDHLNAKLDVTKEQQLCMEIGSMFGWDAPGAFMKPVQQYVGSFIMTLKERDQEFNHPVTFSIYKDDDPKAALDMLARVLDKKHKGFTFSPVSATPIGNEHFCFLRDDAGVQMQGFLNLLEGAPDEAPKTSPAM